MPAVTADTLTLPRLSTEEIPRPRKAVKIIDAPQAYEGEGFPVRRAFAGLRAVDVDPFIHMDQMGEVEYAPGEPKGTPWHPHRGFETFTYLIDGNFLHQDSHGGGGTILDGGTQYMTAGAGVLHIETPPEALVMSGGLFHGVQLWINLPKSKKWLEPQYQDLQGRDSAMLTSADGGAIVRILAGELDGHAGPGISHTPLVITHLTLAPVPRSIFRGGRTSTPWPMYSPDVAWSARNRSRFALATMWCSKDGDLLRITAASSHDARHANLEMFIIGGMPLREPVVQYGPFVMNTRDEIMQAYDDYQTGRFGQIPTNAIQPHRAH